MGSRLSTLADGRPIYEMWLSDLQTGQERWIAYACNPQFSPDGSWVAYDLHDNAQWQSYIDCYANGQVEAYHLDRETRHMLSAELTEAVQLVGWIERP